MADFEVRYLDISWKSPGTVKKLTKSNDALALSEEPDGFSVDTITFPEAFKYVGTRFLNDKKAEPSSLLADGSRKPLTAVKEPGSDHVWWVQLGDWKSFEKKQGGYYYSSLYRTAGKSRVDLAGDVLTINNHTVNFSVDELEYFLKDFKNELWLLILDQTSTITSSVESKASTLFELSNLDYLDAFIDSVEKIIQKPTIELIETTGKVSRRRVRPLPVSFRETISNPSAKTLSSRVSEESYDTNENRYIAYCVNRMRYLLKNMHQVVVAQKELFERRLDQESGWLNELATKKTKKVDSRVLEDEIQTLKQKLAAHNEQLRQALVFDHIGHNFIDYNRLVRKTYLLRIGKLFNKSHNRFFVNELDRRDIRKEFGAKYMSLDLPVGHERGHVAAIIENSTILISGLCERLKEPRDDGSFYFELKFAQVESVEIAPGSDNRLTSEIIRLEETRDRLAQQDWVMPLDQLEIAEQAKEYAVIQKRREGVQVMLDSIKEWLAPIPIYQQRINKLYRFFEKHISRYVTVCPNTMTFVQNPNYAKAKTSYKQFRDKSGVTENYLDEMLKIEEIGLVSVANLYERWCLLQIIKVLYQTYRFIPENEWKSKLLKCVSPNNYDIEIGMACEERQQRIVLTYEKQLANGKRPDFVIDFFRPEYVEPASSDDIWTTRGEERFRLVLDAKFRGEESEATISAIVDELRINKNYSEDEKNPVFVLHPVKHVIDNPTSPLEWGRYCDYGQTVDHKYGSIFLSPSLENYRSAEHLQRLIGQFIQAKGVILTSSSFSGAVMWHNMNCIGCGNLLIPRYSTTKGGKARWELMCSSCTLITIETVCSHCSNPLFKNGIKWTYHRTRATQTSNVVCPSCETFL